MADGRKHVFVKPQLAKQQKSSWNNTFYQTEFHKQLEQIKGQPLLEGNSDKCVKT